MDQAYYFDHKRYCPGWEHERGCPGEQAWDIPDACDCSRPRCRTCAALKGWETRRAVQG